MYYAYILKCADESLYTGCTNDIEKRVKQHNLLKCGARYTKIRRPVVLVYVKKFKSLREARKREVEIKRLSRAEKLQLIKNTADFYDVDG
ncbi:GIY-YIG nuclease family protein [Candidatus Uhrbacteria bacterium]|nr:GIY-YIG nuclease family protein [Candidatus Uhrbacteria bacterium]